MSNIDIDALLESPHTLIAGTTGSGKSVLLHRVIERAVQKGADFTFIDLKRVELAEFRRLKWTTSYASEPKDVLIVLNPVITAMNLEYKKMRLFGQKSSTGTPEYVVVDELAEVVQDKKAVDALATIGRLGRAANIHLICATQDPSRRTLPSKLMQNFTTCVALRCRSPIESRQIIGIKGAEGLPQFGEAIVWSPKGYEHVSIPPH